MRRDFRAEEQQLRLRPRSLCRREPAAGYYFAGNRFRLRGLFPEAPGACRAPITSWRAVWGMKFRSPGQHGFFHTGSGHAMDHPAGRPLSQSPQPRNHPHLGQQGVSAAGVSDEFEGSFAPSCPQGRFSSRRTNPRAESVRVRLDRVPGQDAPLLPLALAQAFPADCKHSKS
jgi:hypothetical protein